MKRLQTSTEGIFVVCTPLLKTGIDITRIGYIINHDTPRSVSEYEERAGRAGRRHWGEVETLIAVKEIPEHEGVTGLNTTVGDVSMLS